MENNGKHCLSDNKLSNSMIIPAPLLRYFSFLLSKVTNKKNCYFLAQGHGPLFEKKSLEWFLPRLVGISLVVVEQIFTTCQRNFVIMSLTLHSNKLETPSLKNSFSNLFSLLDDNLFTTYNIIFSML